MTSIPWLTLAHSRASTVVTEYRQALTELCVPADSTPTFTLMIGRRSKSEVLRQFLRQKPNGALLGGHGQVYLWNSSASSRDRSPSILVDYELNTSTSRKPDVAYGSAIPVRRTVDLLAGGCEVWSRRRVSNMLCGRSIVPFCDTLCYFASDLGGLRSVASLIAEIAMQDPPSPMPLQARPRIVVVVESAARYVDSKVLELRLRTLMQQVIAQARGTEQVDEFVEQHFFDIQVFGVKKGSKSRDRFAYLQGRLTATRKEVALIRKSFGILFGRDHTFALTSRLLDHFVSKRKTPFSFIAATRPDGFCLKQLPSHLTELLHITPVEVWMWHLIVPLLSSAILLASYPPGSHVFPIDSTFEYLFQNHCRNAINTSTTQAEVRENFMQRLIDALRIGFAELVASPSETVVSQHRRQLSRLHPFLRQIKTHRTCLICLLRAPEKVMSCGHAICDVCVQSFGTVSQDNKYTFIWQTCVLCGSKNTKAPFVLIPPTAGVRTLSLDGGGIKGIITLTILKQVEARLQGMGMSIRDCFDFVGGTSAGGLIAIGLFIMQWSIDECIERFETLAAKTFLRPANGKNIFSRTKHMISSFLQDYQYSSTVIAESFQSSFGEDFQLFNPLANDTKVAITTTTAKETAACIFANYNGGTRPKSLGYSLLRAQDSRHDVLISEAACCTSAAPWFFKPRNLRNLGTFQDGGLQYNNPLNLVLWESGFLWPLRRLDFAISIGTGTSEADVASFEAGPYSPVKDRSLSRLFKTLMKSMDGERVWREIYNSVPEREKHRYHRLNLPLTGKEPMLDDVAIMSSLKTQSIRWLKPDQRLITTMDSIFASLFFFELDTCSFTAQGLYYCTGFIYCRLGLAIEARRNLYHKLRASSSYFLVLGQPTVCVEQVPQSMPPFKKTVQFHLESMDDNISVTLLGITSSPKPISGLPQTANELLRVQQSESPFGRADCSLPGKPLPRTPAKVRLFPDVLLIVPIAPNPKIRQQYKRHRTGMFDVPRELRDLIYQYCVLYEDAIQYLSRGRKDLRWLA